MKTPCPFARNAQTCTGLVTLVILLGYLCQTDAHVPTSGFNQAQRRLLENSGDIKSCLSHIGATILLPGSRAYEVSRKRVWNQQTVYHPAAIVVATTNKHVQKAVKCAVKHNIPISPRSGGHSYEGYGNGGADGYVVVDLSGLKTFTFDRRSMTAIVGSGFRLGQLYYRLWKAGKVALPSGTCPTVGVGGHALGGGWGLIGRKYGIATDNIVEALVVTSTGSLVTANKYRNWDLYEALKGAGHNNYGIVVEFKFRVYDVSQLVTHFGFFFSNADLGPVVKVFEDMSRTAPPEITAILRQDGVSINAMSGICLLPFAICEKLLQQYVGDLELDPPSQVLEVEFIQSVLFNGGFNLTDDPALLNVSDNATPEEGYIKATSLIVKGDGLTDKGIDTYVRLLQDGTFRGNAATIFDMYGNNSHTNNLRVGHCDGWVHREVLYGVQVGVNFTANPSNPAPAFAYAKGWNKALLPYADPEAFQNFMDNQQPLSYYYQSNLECLQYTKTHWDHRNVFRYNQSIPPLPLEGLVQQY